MPGKTANAKQGPRPSEANRRYTSAASPADWAERVERPARRPLSLPRSTPRSRSRLLPSSQRPTPAHIASGHRPRSPWPSLRKDFVGAKAGLDTDRRGSRKRGQPADAAKSATYGQAFYYDGNRPREMKGAYPEALRDYLSAVTLLHDDKAACCQSAGTRAEFLIKEKQVIVP